jgi:hypothetical protein
MSHHWRQMSKKIPAKIYRNTFAVFDLGIYQQGLFLVVQWGTLPRESFYLGFLRFAENASTENGTERRSLTRGKKWSVLRDAFVKMAGFQVIPHTNSLLIRLYKVRYCGAFLSLFRKFERLRRHNFAHFTSSPLEKRVIRHELLDCGWTKANQRAV